MKKLVTIVQVDSVRAMGILRDLTKGKRILVEALMPSIKPLAYRTLEWIVIIEQGKLECMDSVVLSNKWNTTKTSL